MENSFYTENPFFIGSRGVSPVLEAICAEYNLPKLGGGSGRGWSFWSTLQRCPQAFYLRYVKPPTSGGDGVSLARDTGSAFHAFQALHWMPNPIESASGGVLARQDAAAWLRDELIERQANGEAVYEGWRLFESHTSYYAHQRGVEYLAVEHPVEAWLPSMSRPVTARYDAIVRLKNYPEVPDGVYIWEYKTARSLSEDMVDGWDLDGEIVGEYTLWQKARLDRVFGPLQGICIDVTTKTKQPQHQRMFVMPQKAMAKRHLRVLQDLELERQRRTKNRYWPQHLQGCVTKFGRCDFYEYCRRLV